VYCGYTRKRVEVLRFQLFDQRSLSGGRAGAPSDTAAMLEFCTNHRDSMCEQFDMKDVNRKAVERVRSGKVRYQAVLAR